MCSSGPREPSKAPPNLEHTMFTEALIEVLRQGDKDAPLFLSIQDLHILISHILYNKFKEESVRPEIHAPAQRHGNISGVPLFPNPARRKSNRNPLQFNNIIQERSVKIIEEKAKEIKSILWKLYINDILPKTVFHKAIEVLDTQPEDLNEEYNSYYILLDRLSTFTPGNFLEEWYKIKVRYLTATTTTDAKTVLTLPLNFSSSIQAQRHDIYG